MGFSDLSIRDKSHFFKDNTFIDLEGNIQFFHRHLQGFCELCRRFVPLLKRAVKVVNVIRLDSSYPVPPILS